PDDPLVAEPAPLPVEGLEHRSLSAVLETVNSNLKSAGQRHPENGVIPAGGVNTLGEVMDGDWYANRQRARRETIAELQRGSGNDRPPASSAPWQALIVKPFGVNPGILVADANHELYILRFDPLGHEGLSTGAQMVSAQFFHALGYHVGENYIVRFGRQQLVA